MKVGEGGYNAVNYHTGVMNTDEKGENTMERYAETAKSVILVMGVLVLFVIILAVPLSRL